MGMNKRVVIGCVYLALFLLIHSGCKSMDRVVMRLDTSPPGDLVMLLDYPKRKIYSGDGPDIDAKKAKDLVWKLLFDWDGFHQMSGYWGPLEQYSGLKAVGYSYQDMYLFQLFSETEKSPMALILPKSGKAVLVVNPYDPVLGIPWGPDETDD